MFGQAALVTYVLIAWAGSEPHAGPAEALIAAALLYKVLAQSKAGSKTDHARMQIFQLTRHSRLAAAFMPELYNPMQPCAISDVEWPCIGLRDAGYQSMSGIQASVNGASRVSSSFSPKIRQEPQSHRDVPLQMAVLGQDPRVNVGMDGILQCRASSPEGIHTQSS